MFQSIFQGPQFLELECSVSRGSDLCWLSSFLVNISEIHPTIQMLARHTYIQHKNQFFMIKGTENV